MRPRRAVLSSTRRFRSSFDEMLAGIAIAAPAPCARSISATTSAQAGALRDETTTRAPASAMRRAIARPMPRDEPVITATLPCSENSDAIERLLIVGRELAPCAGDVSKRPAGRQTLLSKHPSHQGKGSVISPAFRAYPRFHF